MEYQTPFNLLERMDEETLKAEATNKSLRLKHTDNTARYWPSMASLVKKNYLPNGSFTQEVVGSCLRACYYHATSVEPTDDTQIRVINSAEVGKLVEDLVKIKAQQIPEYRVVYPDILGNKLRFRRRGISGEVDLVLQRVSDEKMFGLEVKSYDGAWACINLGGYDLAKEYYKSTCPYVPKFTDRSRKKLNPERLKRPMPKEGHLLQTMIYLDEFWEDDIRLFKILYVARDKGPKIEFDVTLGELNGKKYAVINGELLEDYPLEGIYARFDELTKHLNNSQLPNRDFNPEYDSDALINDASTPNWLKKKVEAGHVHRDWQCDYCPFLGKCLQDGTNDLF